MSIAMERFGAQDQLLRFDIARSPRLVAPPYRLECRDCGFDPADAVTAPSRCPKCGASAWERFASPRSLLMNVEQRKVSQ